MKSALVVVLVCVVLTSAAFAQLVTPRQMGMGGTRIGVADDAAAWHQNPAGLGVMNIPCEEGKEWSADAVASYTDAGDANGFGLTASGWKPASMWGLGAGFADVEDLTSFGIGFGSNWKDSQFSWGLNLMNVDADDDDETLFNLGLMYRFVQPEKAPIRLGLLVEDLTDESDAGPFFSLGVAWPVNPQLLVAVDIDDVTDETDDGPYFSGGVEYSFAGTAWKARAGLADTGDGHDLTLGAGYNFGNNWRVDAAWQNADVDNIWSIGAGFNW